MFPSNDSHSLSSKNFIIELKHFTTKPAKIGGGADSIEKISSKIWGGAAAPCPRLQTPWI